MEKDDNRLVPDNSFVDKIDSYNSPIRLARKTTLPSSLATTSFSGLDRKKRDSRTPPQSLESTSREVYSPANGLKLLSQLSSSSKESETSLSVSSKLHHDLEIFRSGNSTLCHLKSRLYNSPSESEVFKTINCAGIKHRRNKVCQRNISKCHKLTRTIMHEIVWTRKSCRIRVIYATPRVI